MLHKPRSLSLFPNLFNKFNKTCALMEYPLFNYRPVTHRTYDLAKTDGYGINSCLPEHAPFLAGENC